jgi:putative tributyrin esterase
MLFPLNIIISLLFSLTALFTTYAADTETISIRSNVMKKSLQLTIILPETYRSTAMHFPVIYLLHGYGSDHTLWPSFKPLSGYSDSLKIVFVCPDGGKSWYIDSPVGKESLYETFIIGELIPFIDSTYRTCSAVDGRAIMGMSMGGHGAMTLLAKHPDLFIGACSIAGIMDLSEFPRNWGLPKLLGPSADNGHRWKEYSCISQVNLLKDRNKIIILDCGSEDFAFKGNQEEDMLLQNAGIPHYFYSQPGIHDWHYVRAVAGKHILFLIGKMATAK